MTAPERTANLRRTLFLAAILFAAFGALGLLGGPAQAAQAEGPPAAAPPHREAQGAKEPGPVILYTTSWCGYCRKTRALLTELGMPFEDKDIEKSEAAQREYEAKGKGYSGIPLIDFDGTIVRGYSEPQLRALVAARKKRASS